MSKETIEKDNFSAEAEKPVDYLADFENRLSNLKPYSNPQELAKSFATDEIKLYPDKLTGAILWQHDDVFDILISNREDSGYSQGIHDEILSEYKVRFGVKGFLAFLVITKNKKRYLMTSLFSHINHREQDKLLETLKRYRISVAFSADHSLSVDRFGSVFSKYDLDDNSETALATGNYTAEIDKLIWDNTVSQIARKYALTIFEFLRLRLTGTLPEGKRPK